MTRIRVKGIKSYFEPKSGRTYVYHRRSCARIKSPIGSAEFFAEMAAAEASITPRPDAKPGSLELVIAHYRCSNGFLDLRPNTRSEYGRILNLLSSIGGLVMNDLTSADIVRIRENVVMKRNRSAANKTLAILSILFSYAVERGYVDTNPVRGVKKVRRKPGGERRNRPWTKVELDIVMSRAPPHLALPLLIARWTGLRESDVLDLKTGEFHGAIIRRWTLKRGIWVTLPIAAPLRIAIEQRPESIALTICVNSRGASWTVDGFKTSLFKFIRILEREGVIAKGLTFHGLRHTVATELRELGFDARTIADMLGQKTESMAMHYSRDADLQAKLKPAVEKMENAEEMRTKVSRK